jgi:hypothetical protein
MSKVDDTPNSIVDQMVRQYEHIIPKTEIFHIPIEELSNRELQATICWMNETLHRIVQSNKDLRAELRKLKDPPRIITLN